MMRLFLSLFLVFALCRTATAAESLLPGDVTEWHVAPTGDDAAAGTAAEPFRTLARAVQQVQPGEVVTVHAGTYRETLMPTRGGTGENARIVYRAAPGETVVIKCSEPASDWVPLGGDVWELTRDAAFFNGYNPFNTFMPEDSNWRHRDMGKLPGGERQRSLGEVYLDGEPLDEVATFADVAGNPLTWAPSADGLILRAHFGGADPNIRLTEINVRKQGIVPSEWNLGYITIRGFHVDHAANNYDHFFGSAGRLPHDGAISTFGGHHFIIEENVVRYAKSIGIDYGHGGRDRYTAFGGVPELPDSGNNLIRDNRVLDAGATGITGYRSPFNQIIGNAVINANRLDVEGLGSAGIKVISRQVGTIVKDNLIANVKNNESLWMDWAWQGSVVSGNVIIDSDKAYFEANHGPALVDHNIFLGTDVWNGDNGGTTYAHNFFGPDSRFRLRRVVKPVRTPPYYFPGTWDENEATDEPHEVRNLTIYNNIFARRGIQSNRSGDGDSYFNNNIADANVLLRGGGIDLHPPAIGPDNLFTNFDANVSYGFDGEVATLTFTISQEMAEMNTPSITPAFIGPNPISGETVKAIEHDFLGESLPAANPLPGPFQGLAPGTHTIQIWPKETTGETYGGWKLRHWPDSPGPEIDGRLADPDADGISNWQEFGLGTDPNHPDAYDASLRIEATSDGTEIRFPLLDERASSIRYLLQRSPNLQQWSAVYDSRTAPGTSPLHTFQDDESPDPGNGFFYRLALFENFRR